VHIQRIDLLTRLELFVRANDLSPLAFARAAGYARQHLLRLRSGESSPTRRLVIALTHAGAKLTRGEVRAAMLFERGDELLATRRKVLSSLFVDELRQLELFLADVSGDDWAARVLDGVVASEAAVRHLLRTGGELIDRKPRDAETIFSTAAAMVMKLPDTPVELAASLRAHALNGRGAALRHLGRTDEAIETLAHASALFAKARYCANEGGQVEYRLATVLFKQEKWAEARRAAQRARAQFVAAHDTRRAAHADLLTAGTLFDEGNVDAARDMWLRLRSILDDIGDHDALARVWLNLGACEIRRGNAAAARPWLLDAAAAFRRRGNKTELLRTRWNIANYVLEFRSATCGIRALQRVEDGFGELGALTDAACVGLDAIEAMIRNGMTGAPLARYATRIAGLLTASGLRASAAVAVDQLRRIGISSEPAAVVAEMRVALRRAAAWERPHWPGAPPAHCQ
jgi:tetratricopeptide (TPR) repeat protein